MTNLAINLTIDTTLQSTILPASIEALNFDKLKFKLTSAKEAVMSKDVCQFAEQEYKRFLALKYFYPKETFVPNKLVDEFWHAHILDDNKELSNGLFKSIWELPAPLSIFWNS